MKNLVPGRRRGAQLRRQRPDPARGHLRRLWIQPAAGDAGGALGAALFVWHQLLDKPRQRRRRARSPAGLAARARASATTRSRRSSTRRARRITASTDEEALLDRVAETIAEEQGRRLVPGPDGVRPARARRAHRSSATRASPKMQSVMNLKIKFRESFRPFAPCVLREHAHEWFDVRPGEDSPYMLLVAAVRRTKRLPVDAADRERLRRRRSARSRSSARRFPAVTHVDYSARVQTVDPERHGRLPPADASGSSEQTGCPVIINTSFNVRGEPIVCSPEHAYRCFMATNMDVLVLEHFVLLKDEQPQAAAHEVDAYLAQFQLD